MTFFALSKHLVFCAALAMLSAVVVRRMITAGLLDQPDARKVHSSPIPKGGGVGVVAAFLAGMAVLYAFADFARIAGPYFLGVILASLAIAAVAFLDDLRDWPFTVKLGAQVAAALVAVASGLAVSTLHVPLLGPIALGVLAGPAAVAWILFTTNAMNFIDGLNGLASGVTVIACAALAGIAAASGSWFVYAASLLLASGLLGFMPFNFPRARIFMGDVGSQFCGFVLAVLGVVAARFDRAEMSALLVPMLLSGVLFDVAFTLVRRVVAGDNPTRAHRSHLYQIAHRSGLDPVAVTLVHWGFALWGAACCALFLAAAGADKALVPLLVLAPQPFWIAFVVARARRARLGRW